MPSLEQEELALLRQRVVRLEAQVEFLYRHLNVTFEADSRAGDDPQVIEALKSRTLIEAIQIYRRNKGGSLADAKDAVEDMQRRLGL